MSAQTRSSLLICLLLIIISLIVFWRVLDHEFVTYDDPEYVINNTHVHNLTLENIKWAFTASHASNWHPLTWMSHMLDYRLYGPEPKGHHATNLLFHITNSLLLFLLLTRMTGSIWRSGFVAALFAVHPLHVESVAWVSERKDVLSTFFWILAIWAYMRYAERPGVARYLPVMVLFALGLMSKPMLVTLPITLLLLDYWPLGRLQIKWNLIWEKTPLFAMSIASCVITFIAQEHGKALRSLESFPIMIRVENALVAYTSYLIKMVFPRGLAVLYPHPQDTLPGWQVVAAVLLLVCITMFAIRARNRRPYFAMGWFWYIGTLIPVIGLVQVGLQSMADRYTYVPLIGIFVAITWSITEWEKGRVGEKERHDEPRRKRKKKGKHHDQPSPIRTFPQSPILAVSSCAVVAILMACAWKQVGYWQNSLTLFTHATQVTANNYVAHTNLGEALLKEGDLNQAIEHFSEAIQINPGSVQAQNNIGHALLRQGKIDEAISHLSEAVKLDRESAEAHYNLGNALKEKRQYKESFAQYSEALRINPDYANAYNNMGLVLAAQGKIDEAVDCYRKALRIDPELVEAYTNMGGVYLDQSKYDRAIECFSKALDIKPDFAAAHHNLAAVLFFKGDYSRAWEEIRLCRQYGLSPNPHLIELLSQKMPEKASDQ